jgi:LacI family transcriptional regulator
MGESTLYRRAPGIWYNGRMKSIRVKSGRKSGAPRRVVVALRMAGIAGQDKLNGIFDHLSSGHRWQLIIYRTRQEFTAATVRHEMSLGTNGFIVGIPDADDALAELAALDVPTVVMNVSGGGIEKRRRNVAHVKSDSVSVGRTAALTLMRQGVYKSYAYAGYRSDSDWSRERGRAFAEELGRDGLGCEIFDIGRFGDMVEDKGTLKTWLKELPKPCGLLAACDDRAFEILDVCRESKISVPSEIGVLGVNNDPLLCENSEPRLSSIQPDFIGEGRLAAELLESIMAGRDVSEAGRTQKVGIRTIVHRDSTIAYSKSGMLVQKILAYINAEALNGIGVEDVAGKFKISRSLLELRFRELQGESVYEAILRVRLEEVKRRLRTTDDTISEITAACGWKNPAPPKTLFKRRFGVSMRDYRRQKRV